MVRMRIDHSLLLAALLRLWGLFVKLNSDFMTCD